MPACNVCATTNRRGEHFSSYHCDGSRGPDVKQWFDCCFLFLSPLLNTFSSLWCRCSEFPLQDQDVHISWHAPCVWWLLPSWNVAGVRERARDSRSATRSGRRTLVRPSSQRSVCGELLLTHPCVKFKRGKSWLYLRWGWSLLCSITSSAAVFS